jgi:monolysocardiolipin acyltransferase
MDSLLEPEDSLERARLLRAPWGAPGRAATLGAVAAACKLVLGGLNRVEVANGGAFRAAVLVRPPGEGLITVSNHTSTLDDPALLCALLPWRFFATEAAHGRVRWALCARELCYANPFLAAFFASGKTLPVERGAGVGQPVMRVAAGEVARGGWLHLFPEGRVGYSGALGPLRWGVGKVVCDAALARGGAPPTVLPFYHSGMGGVMPRRARVPRAGRRVDIVVGEPVALEPALIARCGAADEAGRCAAWRDIAERVGDALRELEARAPPNVDQTAARDEGAMPSGDVGGAAAA